MNGNTMAQVAIASLPALILVVRATWPAGHQHDWTYARRPIGGTGWGIATCLTCGEWDLY